MPINLVCYLKPIKIDSRSNETSISINLRRNESTLMSINIGLASGHGGKERNFIPIVNGMFGMHIFQVDGH